MQGGIAIFDSGVGGLTVLKEFAQKGCNRPIYYYGDNGNAPYGNKTEDEIFYLTYTACKKLMSFEPSAIVLGCNTATAVCIERLRALLPIPIIGTEPALKPACEKYNEIILLSTKATAKSERIQSMLKKYSDKKIACFSPVLLASAVEEYLNGGRNVDLSAHLTYCRTQAIVLGCTHYVFLKERISQYYDAPIFDGGEGVYRRTKQVVGFEKYESEIFFCGKYAEMNSQVFYRAYPKIKASTTILA